MDTKNKRQQIYYLIDERDNTVCYVGKTLNPLPVRLQRHRSAINKHMWVWLHRHPVRIEKAFDGDDWAEKKEIRRLSISLATAKE